MHNEIIATTTVYNPHLNHCYEFKLVMLGDTTVGKSSVVFRFVKNEFFEYQESTIGAAFLTQTVAINDYKIKFVIWDTAGQEKYYSLAPMYYRGAYAATCIYDITSLESFKRAKKWIEELQRMGPIDCVIACGNKVDLEHERLVKYNDAKQYARENNLRSWRSLQNAI